MTEQRWDRLAFWPLLVGALLFAVIYSVQVIAGIDGPAYLTVRITMTVLWVMFAADYAVRLAIASPRGRWFRRHLFDLAVVALPVLRPLRLLRVVTVVRTFNHTAGDALRSRILVYGAGAAIILIWMAALAELEAERGDPHANIRSFGDALWWAFVTLTTVGYGDYHPVTVWGRVIAVLLMCGGVAVIGVISATAASWLIERAGGAQDDDEPATRRQVRDLSAQVEALTTALGERRPD